MSESVWDRLCAYEFVVKILSILVFTLGVLTLFSFPYLERGSAEYVIASYNLLVITIFIAIIGLFRYKCG
ncbi:hypothetical protein GS429_00110 [Natronorubrum sp. JWXQ-INN-674]|uniref:Uncharacterized protein n=1 Tax=Natronorubrum halalkaliphilum TaxID=2691917 RepID=A0A6B0VG71_9EURY|nr:hypothetical protein [Natronorubrum halalkaliphilum]MXV60498.1 hypothetical protein [Natronorubrum halalkaliphilum]